MPDGSIMDEQNAYAVVDFIDVSKLNDVFYLYYGDDKNNIGEAIRIA